MDNHNHALFFRYRETKQLKTPLKKGEESADADGGFKKTKTTTLIHIDQHADIKPNLNSFNATYATPKDTRNFTNYACNVGNFITSAQEAGIIDDVIQIRTEYALQQL